MKLKVSKEDVGKIMRDLVGYSEPCGHEGIDFCCVYCQAKRIVNAYEQDELELEVSE